MESNYLAVLVTVPNREVGNMIAKKLVTEKIAACANIIPQITSIYTWEGDVCEDTEYLLIIKTQSDLFDRLSTLVQTIHPYNVPEVIGLPIITGSQNYLQWIESSTGQ